MTKTSANLFRVLLSFFVFIMLLSGVSKKAKAENDMVSIDFSQGQIYSMTTEELSTSLVSEGGKLTNAPSNVKDTFFSVIFMRLLGYGENGSTATVIKRNCLLNRNPIQILYADFYKDSTEGANDGSYSLNSGKSLGTFEATIGENFKSKQGYVVGNDIIMFAERIYGIKAVDSNGKRYVKIKYTFLKPDSGYVYIDESGTVNAVIPGSEFEEKGYYYRVTGKGEVAFIGLAKKSIKNVNIQDTVIHQNIKYRITSVSNKALYNNKKIKSVKIGKNVTKIGGRAFAKCVKLKKISIKSASVKKIGKKAIFKNPEDLVVKVPKSKYKKYKKLLKNAGASNVTIKKII